MILVQNLSHKIVQLEQLSHQEWSYSQKKMCPKFLNQDTAIDRSFTKIRLAHKKAETELFFIRYHQSSSVVYRPSNKHHHVQPEHDRLVLTQDVIYALANQFNQPNRMEHLHFDLCHIKDAGLQTLMQGQWNNLIELDLSQNKLTALSIKHLISPHNLNCLKQLKLCANNLDHHAAELLVKGQWKDLQELNLDFNDLRDQGIKKLSDHKWSRLKELHLLGNSISNEGLTGIIAMKMSHLQGLYLGFNLLTDDGCKILARGRWRLLKVLQLEQNNIQDDGIGYLTKLPCFNLVNLKLVASKININVAKQSNFLPSMSGLTKLLRGCWNRLKIEISMGKMGPVNTQNFMLNKEVKDMLELRNVVIAISYK